MKQIKSSHPDRRILGSTFVKEFAKAAKLFEDGNLAPARGRLERIVARHPDHISTINYLAAIAGRTGELPKALNYALRAVELEPTNGPLRRNVAQILFQMSRYEEAADACRIGTQLDPRNGSMHSAYGITLRVLERWEEATDAFLRGVELDPTLSEAFDNLAAIAGRAGDLPKALEYALNAVKLEPCSGALLRNVGQILFRLSRYQEAAEACRIATQLDPHDASFHCLHGVTLRVLERWDEATDASLRAIALDPTCAEAFDNLAITLVARRDYGKALLLFHEAIRLAPHSAVAWTNLGNFLGTIGGRTAEAATALRSAVVLDPHDAVAHMSLGMALLKLGDFENGWREYEHRVQNSIFSTVGRPASLPKWDGSASPRTLLLHAEQGLGDTLQFCRYAPLVASSGHRVVLAVQPELVELVANSMASDSVTVISCTDLYSSLAVLPPVEAHCPLMSLPMLLGTRLENVPAAPYLHADPVCRQDWGERLAALAGPLHVGLVWAGSPRRESMIAAREIDARRSTTLASLGPLLDVPGVSFVSLQKGPGAEELRDSRFAAIYDADHELNSFADTASLVANLDLVITVDTSVAHLVGGMGKPVWMLSRFDGCFRWLEDRDDTPWYPTMRIFRQGAECTWGPVVASLARALAQHF
jgi:Flp pilus assembly protein TadD